MSGHVNALFAVLPGCRNQPDELKRLGTIGLIGRSRRLMARSDSFLTRTAILRSHASVSLGFPEFLETR